MLRINNCDDLHKMSRLFFSRKFAHTHDNYRLPPVGEASCCPSPSIGLIACLPLRRGLRRGRAQFKNSKDLAMKVSLVLCGAFIALCATAQTPASGSAPADAPAQSSAAAAPAPPPPDPPKLDGWVFSGMADGYVTLN